MQLAARVQPATATTARQPVDMAVDSVNVEDWVGAIDEDHRELIRDVQAKYVAGMCHLPGGDALGEAFDNLKYWILGVAELSGWQETAFKTLGQRLLDQLRIQRAFVVDKIPRTALVNHMRKNDKEADPIAQAVSALRSKPTVGSRNRKSDVNIKCLSCGQLGHRKKDCPSGSGNGKAGGKA